MNKRRHGCLRTEERMVINGVKSTGIQPGTMGMGPGEQMDAVSKDLQNQIENLQKQMKELSANQEMSTEAKMKKRQELQKQISDLEVQLRQHQMEVKREAAMKKREEKGSMDDLLGVKKQEKQDSSQNAGMSAGSMEALISADTSMKQAGVHGRTAKKAENRANVLEVEISLDVSRGGDPKLKREELANMKEVAQQATTSQMESLAEAGKTLQDAAKDENEQKVGNAGKDEEDKKTNAPGEEEEQKSAGIMAEEDQDRQEQNTFDVEMPGVAFSRGYQPVDIKL